MVNSNNKFNFYVDVNNLKKGKDATTNEDVVYVEGIASTTDSDSDEEQLSCSGFNLEPLMTRGHISYNHQSGKDPNCVIGVPLEAKIVNNGHALHVKAMLWQNDITKGILQAVENFEKYAPNRKLQWSIEGKATEKDPHNKKKILRADITGLTLCLGNAKNSQTFANILKGNYDTPFLENPVEKVEKGMTKSEALTILTKRYPGVSTTQIDSAFRQAIK